MQWLFWWRPPVLLRQVIVTLKDDPSTGYQGALWSSRGPWLTLRDVSVLKANHHPPTRMDGEMVFHRSNLSFFQALP